MLTAPDTTPQDLQTGPARGWPPVERPWRLALLAAVLLKVPVPLWPSAFSALSTLSTLVLAAAALLWARERTGPRAFGLFALAFGIGLGVEVLGSRSGFPFGTYAYGPSGPALLGVPLLVPLGWWAMAVAALALAGSPARAGLLMVAWDLALEPLMTRQGLWSWSGPGGLWYGAPAANFAAWYAVAVGVTTLLARLAPRLAHGGFGAAYRLEAAFLPAGLALWGLWDAAALSGLAMNAAAWWPRRRRAPPSARWVRASDTKKERR